MNKDGQDIETLLGRALSGEIGEEDAKHVQEWRRQSPENEEQYQVLKKFWRSRFAEPRYINSNQLKERIVSEGFGKQLRVKSFYLGKYYKAAAVLVIVFLLGYVVYNNRQLEYSGIGQVSEKIIEKYNPPGAKSRIVLPDGTVVWLNADSKLTYTKALAPDKRLVKLKGEAYFEVYKDPNRPFIVQSGAVYTEALGTSFNIRHFDNENSIDIALLTGKVSVSTNNKSKYNRYFLTHNEKIVFSLETKEFRKSKMETAKDIMWKDNIIHFQNASFEYVIKTLERWYGVGIDFSGYSNRNWDYVGDFDNLSLEQVLKRIGYSQSLDFTINDDKISIYDKQ